jgi:hypothetical protein
MLTDVSDNATGGSVDSNVSPVTRPDPKFPAAVPIPPEHKTPVAAGTPTKNPTWPEIDQTPAPSVIWVMSKYCPVPDELILLPNGIAEETFVPTKYLDATLFPTVIRNEERFPDP